MSAVVARDESQLLGMKLRGKDTHPLPNAMAFFIFSSHHESAPRNRWHDTL